MQTDQEVLAETTPTKELLKLRRCKVSLEQLYLDPNNPRFGTPKNTQDYRIPEDGVQQAAQREIEKIGIDDLLSSVRRYGFAPTDPVVVRRLPEEKFVVLEGNRRVATMKKLYAAYKQGEPLDEDVVTSIMSLEILVYEGQNPDIVWLVQGLRHMSGIKEWPPLQQAAFIAKIEQQLSARNGKRGRPPGLPTIAKTAGVGTQTAARLLRSYHGFKQAREDEEYGDIRDEKFSMFAEAIFKREALWSWLEWDDELRSFQNTGNLKKFLSWITKSEDEEPKISRANPEARDILPNIIADPELLRRFENGSLDIYQANAEVKQKQSEREIDLDALRRRLEEFLRTIDALPLPRIERENQHEVFRPLLETLQQAIKIQIGHLSE